MESVDAAKDALVTIAWTLGMPLFGDYKAILDWSVLNAEPTVAETVRSLVAQIEGAESTTTDSRETPTADTPQLKKRSRKKSPETDAPID